VFGSAGEFSKGRRRKRFREAYLSGHLLSFGSPCNIDMFASTSSVGRTQSIGME
jgi:hypothetical protein